MTKRETIRCNFLSCHSAIYIQECYSCVKKISVPLIVLVIRTNGLERGYTSYNHMLFILINFMLENFLSLLFLLHFMAHFQKYSFQMRGSNSLLYFTVVRSHFCWKSKYNSTEPSEPHALLFIRGNRL